MSWSFGCDDSVVSSWTRPSEGICPSDSWGGRNPTILGIASPLLRIVCSTLCETDSVVRFPDLRNWFNKVGRSNPT